MPRVTIVLRDGSERALEAEVGLSLMECMREHGIDEVLALCGGCLSCATCHVHVDEEWLDSLPPMSSDEDDLLDNSTHRNPRSRLSCQIPVTEGLDGLRVTIAPEDL